MKDIVLTAQRWANSNDNTHTFAGVDKTSEEYGNVTSLNTVIDMMGLKIKHGDKIKVTIEKVKSS